MSDPDWAGILFVCQAQTTAGKNKYNSKYNKITKYTAANHAAAGMYSARK
jgi:hypothetical protein